MDIVIYRDVGGFPVWFGLRSCFFCVTCCFWLHQAWPSRRTVVVFRLWWELPPPSVMLLDFRWNDYYTSGLSYPKWRHWRCGGWSKTWVWCPNEWGHGCKFPSRGEEFGHSGGTQNTAVAPPHWKQPLKVVQVSEDDASLMPPGWDVSGMSHQEGRYTGEILSFGWVGNTSCHGWIDVYLVRRRQWYVTLDSFQTIWDLGSLHH